jgi:dipeptidyl aminopeptidase/acylaminoacyl peptidase
LSKDIPWDIGTIAVDRTSGHVAFTVNEAGISRLYLLEKDQPRLLSTPMGVIDDLEFSPDGKQLGFSLGQPTAPTEAFSILLADGSVIRWTYSEVGGLNPATFLAPTPIAYRSFDGRAIPAFYYRPKTATRERPAPVVISIHGGPESQFRPTFQASAQFYALELGFAVLAPNVRGSAGYGKSYLTLDNANKREDSVRDIGALLDWIAKQPELDRSRVAVMGGSYGGYMVLASLVHFGERLRAGVDIVGIASFTTFLNNTSAYRRDLRRAEYGDERDPAMRQVFERINPINHAERIRSALLVAHGTNDPRVPFSEAEQLVAKVKRQSIPVWTVYANNEGHGFGKKENADYLAAVIAQFLQDHLR